MSRIYFLEAKTEFLKLMRMRAYVVFTILFPLMFYCFFGLAMGTQSANPSLPPMARYLLATYGAFAVMGVTLYAFGVGVAVERGLGWLQLKRASPMPPAAYFFAKFAVSLAFSAIVLALLFGLGAVFGGVRMPVSQWLALYGTLMAGGTPFCALGLIIGSLAGPNSASPAVNLIYMPMSICSGLWVPLQFLPRIMQNAAPLLPSYHLAQLALAVLHAPTQGAALEHVQALAGFTCLFAGIAWFANSRESEKMYG
jgi:ABC-2 type transport system permease protein